MTRTNLDILENIYLELQHACFSASLREICICLQSEQTFMGNFCKTYLKSFYAHKSFDKERIVLAHEYIYTKKYTIPQFQAILLVCLPPRVILYSYSKYFFQTSNHCVPIRVLSRTKLYLIYQYIYQHL